MVAAVMAATAKRVVTDESEAIPPGPPKGRNIILEKLELPDVMGV